MKIAWRKNDSKVLEALCNESPLQSVEIAEITGIHRPNVFDSLNNLHRFGVIVKNPNQKGSWMLSPRDELTCVRDKTILQVSNMFKRLIDANPSQSQRCKIRQIVPGVCVNASLTEVNIIKAMLEEAGRISPSMKRRLWKVVRDMKAEART